MFKKILKAIVLGGAFWLVFLLPNIQNVFANHIVWEAPVTIESRAYLGEFREIQKDTLGNTYFAYNKDTSPYIATVDISGNITKDFIWPTGGSSGIADFKVDSQNNLHAIVFDGTGTNSRMHYFFKAAGSNIWEKYYSNYYFNYYFDVHMAIENPNKVHISYDAGQSENWVTNYIQINNKIWGTPELISEKGGNSIPYFDNSGTLNIIYASSISFETPGDIINLKKTQTGWQSTTILNNKMISGAAPDLLVDSNGNIHYTVETLNSAYTIVYDLYLKIDPSLNIIENTVINTSSLGDASFAMKLALDSQERPIVSFQKKKSGSCSYSNYRDSYYAQKIGNVWETGLIEKCTDGSTELGIDFEGKLIAAYYRNVSGLGATDMFYKRGIISSQPLPSTTITTPQVSTLTSANTNFNVSWTPSTTGTYNYDVEYRMENGTTYTPWLSAIALTSSTFPGAQGKTYCFRARSNVGSTKGAWSTDKCTGVPLDDSATTLSYSSAWSTLSNANYYLGTAKRSNTTNSTLTYTTNTHYFALIGTKGPNMGKVKVEVDGVAKTYDLYSSSAKYRQPIAYKIFANGSNTHTIKVTVLGTKNTKSSGTNVEIDGVVGIVN